MLIGFEGGIGTAEAANTMPFRRVLYCRYWKVNEGEVGVSGGDDGSA